MKGKVRELRQRLIEAKEDVIGLGTHNPAWDHLNLIEFYRLCQHVIQKVDELGTGEPQRFVETYRKMRLVIKAGDVYYTAKKHGLDQAMLIKLGQ